MIIHRNVRSTTKPNNKTKLLDPSILENGTQVIS